MGYRLLVLVLLSLTFVGCGTTKWTDTGRSATEQLLISDAMDRAVSQLDFRALAGKTVYLDSEPLKGVTDSAYLISSIRQHMLASGCILKDQKSEAKYIVEVRSGAVGTDHHELVYGVPRVNIPALIPVSGVGIPPNIPEIKLVTRTNQRAVVKIAVFAYNRETGRPVWQSGIFPAESRAKAIWVFGAGPFQRGDIYGGTSFAGDKLNIPLVDLDAPDRRARSVAVAEEAFFVEPPENVAQKPEGTDLGDAGKPGDGDKRAAPAGGSSEVVQAAHTEPADAEGAGDTPPADAPGNDTPPAQTPPAKTPEVEPAPSEQPAVMTTPAVSPIQEPAPQVLLSEATPAYATPPAPPATGSFGTSVRPAPPWPDRVSENP